MTAGVVGFNDPYYKRNPYSGLKMNVFMAIFWPITLPLYIDYLLNKHFQESLKI